ncbi:enoyl-CoA hydratase/isomerase family protein [Halostagnicola sp. A-GB9-2]|uniref:enoyl-CoA hydratase/isomerase family protein n=1 Tax=Halostagnicola sp. A-GB9-2 TaxID=3048066 RepID=UPI0024C0DB85|nr:enoyl-CoA hydratase/isomerase family protein [Halostagnicola sp. A-GB9-2]MDJ1433296.1 enoyl-CoA hydratase/isomerase family protein [Halostagnicola sp. A-GB9-2]
MITETERVHESVRIEHIEDESVARLVLEANETSLNVFHPSSVEALATAVESLSGEVDAIVLYGEPVFSAGADLDEIEQTPQEMRSAKIDTIAGASNRFIRSVRSFPAPVIAGVTGVAAGGGLGFVLASDLVYMHEDAVLNTGYARVGLTPDNAAPFFLVKTVGPYKARELFFDPEPITASEAVDLGLANECFDGPEATFVDRVTERAIEYANGPTETYARTKELVDTVFEGHLDQHLEEERAAIKRMSDSDVFDEGLSAFLENRQPEWE